MAILKAEEIRDMSAKEREEKLNDLKLELSKEDGKVASGGFPEDPGRIKEIKRTIARIKTIENQKEKR
ncbi:MAG: 50S ribosomal protein L29 [Candidatus Nanohaloarchaeota archaeon QJJ-9]|nr:50S ribosomal protein L29 [Candidatus Nanohaloarchaeota archaeon QJJ-9]